MLVKTRHFGEIEVDEEGLIDFPEGLPGFENAKKFILLQDEKSGDSPFKWLQGVDRPDVAFVVVNPLLIKKDYDAEIPDKALEKLGVKEVGDMQIYSIVVVPEDITKTSMNLRAPVVINEKNRKGAQIVLDTDVYSVRHYILDELRKQEDSRDACADKEKGPVDCNK